MEGNDPYSLKKKLASNAHKYLEKLKEFGLKRGQSLEPLSTDKRIELELLEAEYYKTLAKLQKHHPLLRGGKRNKCKTKRRVNKKRKTYKK